MNRYYKRVVLQWNNGVLEIYPDDNRIFGDIVILENVWVFIDFEDAKEMIKIDGNRLFYTYLYDRETPFSSEAIERAHPSVIEDVWIERSSGFWFWKKYWSEQVKKINLDRYQYFRKNKEESYSLEGKFPFVIIN